MPYQAGPTERDNLTAARTEMDRLTRENDWLRELTIRLLNGEPVTKEELECVRRDQIHQHRKEDLARLEKQFRASIADQKAMGREGGTDLHAKLGLVVTADPSRPLTPQLGFDPDSV
jgi:hypothetical protein